MSGNGDSDALRSRGTHRTDPLTGYEVEVVASRQARPNRPDGCPFCVGGIEAPEPYRAKAFTNRWSSFPDDRCEVVLYSPEHTERLSTMPPEDVRRVIDLWADRTASLGSRSDIDYVLVFENHGAEVGATIEHPHGQIFAFDRIPELPARELARLADGHALLEDDPAGERVVVERGGWRAWVPYASIYPYSVRIAPLARRPDLASLSTAERDALADVLADVLGRLERRFDRPMPYMFWWHQRPTDGGEWSQAWLHLDIAGPWRDDGVMRYVAGGELGSGTFVNPVAPEQAAADLRNAGVPTETL